jgi:hypothetical protein
MTDFSMTTKSSPAMPIVNFVDAVRTGSRTLTITIAVFAVGFIICTALQFIDARLLLGVSVWEKPAKFFFSLATHFATVAWALSLLNTEQRATRGIIWAVRLMVAAAVLELIYIVARAARGEASHFNTGTPLDAALYSIMGIGALTLTFTAGYVGFRIWRARQGSIWREAAGFGLMLGAVLGTLTAGYMSSQTGHHVGGDLNDALGLPFFHWSTTHGDLRVAHFVGLHAMQVVPFAALSGKRSVVYAVALAITALTAFTFAQAVLGIPLFRVS